MIPRAFLVRDTALIAQLDAITMRFAAKHPDVPLTRAALARVLLRAAVKDSGLVARSLGACLIAGDSVR